MLSMNDDKYFQIEIFQCLILSKLKYFKCILCVMCQIVCEYEGGDGDDITSVICNAITEVDMTLSVDIHNAVCDC